MFGGRLDLCLGGPFAPDDPLGIGLFHGQCLVNGHKADPRAGGMRDIGRAHRHMPAGAVDDKNIRRRCHGSLNDIPRAGQLIAARHPVDIRNAAGGDDHKIGVAGHHIPGAGKHPASQIDTKPFDLGNAPVDNADHVAPPAGTRRQQNLSAGARRCLEQRHLMAALGGNPRRLQSARPGADDDHAPR